MSAASSLPFSGLVEVGAPAPARPSFQVFDDVVRLPDASGALVVETPNAEVARAVARHVERRAHASQRRVVRSVAGDDALRDVASRLGTPLTGDAAEVASAIAQRATAAHAIVVVELSPHDAWGRAVLHALVAARPAGVLLIALLASGDTLELDGATAFQVEERLDDAALARWWDAVAAAEHARGTDQLATLDVWHAGAQRLQRALPAPEKLDADARELLVALHATARAWPRDAMGALGSEAALAALEATPWVEVRDGLVEVCGDPPGAPSDPTRVAHALLATYGDGAAYARAGELYAVAGLTEEAGAAFRTALARCDNTDARVPVWARWRALVQPADGETLLAGAELALALGDVDVALEWAKLASAAAPGHRAALVLGRAALSRGDLLSAEAALSRARDAAETDAARQRVMVEMAEVRYARGDLAEAERVAKEVHSSSTDGAARLGARNLLGKLLLARGDWNAADAHFAEDACDAISLGDSTAELRARVNRAIALLSRGSSDEAHAMLDAVLADAEQRGEPRAVAFALSNLAVLAIERHDYARALTLFERTTVVHRQLGDRLGFARDITNLVELRLRVGLIDQAEQALRFGRGALGAGAPASRLTELSLAAARVHLARGRSVEAEREVRAALRSATHSSDGDKLGECHRLAARIALEDGIVARAQAEVQRAQALAVSPYNHAETAVLQAAVARAAGQPALAAAEAALHAARESTDEELMREAHVLVAEALMGEGDDEAAEGHVRAGQALCDEVVALLPVNLRDSYLARPDVMRLARLARIADGDASPESRAAVKDEVPAARKRALTYVGRHPAVRALLDSVRRVSPTDSTVLVLGESGTGKELVAELIHAGSGRATGPLVKVNCAALVESLLLSELFGHEKGAFTGAAGRKRGRFERADGGTLFLDEIGDISPRTQVALLRVLEERSFERVGGTSPIPVDVRIVCATNRDLRTMVERGEFREDLYYRLSGITLSVPALRDRPADLPLLCESLLERIGRERAEAPKTVSREAIELLGRHRWPGNVRELENALRAASLFAVGNEIQVSDFVEHVEALRRLPAESMVPRLETRRSTPPPGLAEAAADPAAEEVTGVAYREIREAGVSLADLKRNIERECIARALAEIGGNITRAASVLGMKRPRLSQLVKQYGLLDASEDAS